mmetsp:Transcript_7620/g.12688  ORF Transcript_7620/g.12688 Transcript_7620/m.12688 type:complete len:122 (-) Transcript_7620:73-438(-)
MGISRRKNLKGGMSAHVRRWLVGAVQERMQGQPDVSVQTLVVRRMPAFRLLTALVRDQVSTFFRRSTTTAATTTTTTTTARIRISSSSSSSSSSRSIRSGGAFTAASYANAVSTTTPDKRT